MTYISSTPQDYRIKIVANADFVKNLKDEVVADPSNIKAISEKVEKDAARLGFDVQTVVSLLLIIKGTFEVTELARRIFQTWRSCDNSKIVLQTPFQTLELHKSSTITQVDIQKFIEAAKSISA